MFDGTESYVGGQSSGSMFTTYNPIVQSQLGTTSQLIMDGAYTIIGNTATVSVTIEVDLPVTSLQNEIYFVAVEDHAHAQVYLAREASAPVPFTLTDPGQTITVSQDLELETDWDRDNLAFVVFVHSANSREVLQATRALADYAATITVDCEPDGVDAPWHMTGPNGFDLSSHGDYSLPVFHAGDYTLVWDEIPGWTAPATNPIVIAVPEEGMVTFSGEYTDGPFLADTTGALGDTGDSRSVSLVDYDQDGDLDIYVVNYNGPNRLLLNNGAGGYADVATGLLADSGPGHAAVWGDYDRDGDVDVYISQDNAANLLLENDSSGNFVNVAAMGMEDDGPGRAVSWADLDNDGWLDIHLVNFDMANQVFKNYGDFGGDTVYFFTIAGIIQDTGPGTGAAWCDYDNDGDQDIYLANRFAGNMLFEYAGSTFYESNNPLLEDLGGGSGTAWGDFDNDGDFDLYLANDGGIDFMYRNADGVFSLAIGDNLGDTGHGRGVVWADFDNDMYLDLYIARHGEPDLYLINNGDGDFTRTMVGWDEAEGPGNSAATGDLNGDGLIDVYVARSGQSNVLLLNNRDNGNHWLQVRLTGVEASTNGIGATVRVTAGGVTQIRAITAGSGYCAQNAPIAAFGLGSNPTADSVEITWPDGEIQTLYSITADQILHVTEGAVIDAVDDQTGIPAIDELRHAYPNPFNPATTVSFSLAHSGPARLDVFTLDGSRVATLVDEVRAAGNHRVTWHGTDDTGRRVASGTYFFRLVSGDFSHTERVVLIK